MINKLKTYDDATLDRQIQSLCQWTKTPKVDDAGGGIILRTPDGTKQYMLTVSNAGALVITLV